MEKVVAQFHSSSRSKISLYKFLVEHFKNAFFLKKGYVNEITSNYCFTSNEEFWKTLLNERNTLRSLTLSSFRIVDWVPRSPGLFHTEDAKYIRGKAERSTCEIDGRKIYKPDSKFHMIEGGIGSVRFKPIIIDGHEYLMCSATSDNYCHSGIPLAISTRDIQKIDFSNYNLKFTIDGQIKFLPNLLDEHFIHLVKIPRIYLLVENFKEVAEDNLLEPVQITPMIFFTTEFNSFKSKQKDDICQDNDRHCVAYASCYSHTNKELDLAVNWLKSYVNNYNGVIITNFDQQRPAFETALFSLQNIMNNNFLDIINNADRLNIMISQTSNEHIEGNKIVISKKESTFNLQGAQFGGGLVDAETVNAHQIGGNITNKTTEQKQNLVQTATEIQQLFTQLEQTNPTTTTAQKMAVVAQAVDEIEKNPTLKARVVDALKSGGAEALKEALNHPLVNLFIAAVEDWQ